MFKAKSTIDYTTRDYEGFRTDLINQLKLKIPEYTDFSESDVGIVILELLSYGLDIQSYYLDRVANEVHLHTALDRGNIIELCKNYGYVLRNATASQLNQVFEVTPVPGEDTIIPKNFLVSTAETTNDPKIYFETMRELVIPEGKTGMEKDEEGNYLYVIPVVQGFTIQEELLGSSLGTPDQEFTLHYSSVLDDTIEIMIEEGKGVVEWTKVDNFLNSSPQDRHYTVSIDDDDIATIKFGSGSVGMIPPKLDENIFASYRVGGGVIGNVTKGVINQLEHNLANIISTHNISIPTIFGVEKESVEEAKRNAVFSLRTLEKAVTLQDYEDLAYNLNFTHKVKAEEVADGKTINIYILPKFEAKLNEEQTKEAIELYEEYKMIGTNPVISSPEYVPINLTINCDIKSSDTDIDYKESVKEVVSEYFKVGNFTFKQNFSKANLTYSLMDLIPNLIDVNITGSLSAELTAKQIITLGTLTINITEV